MAIVTSTSDSVRTGSTEPEPTNRKISDSSWQQLIKTAIRNPRELLRRVGLPVVGSDLDGRTAADDGFRTFVPESWLARIRHGDPNDPLLRQVLPDSAETDQTAGFQFDAVGDQAAICGPGLIHKYRGRALLMTSGVCAINCRYCFRRHFPYETAPRSIAEFEQALQIVRQDQSLHEIILSGGDPLMLTDQRLHELIELIAGIEHIRRLRIHTRLPVVIPQRVTLDLTKSLRETRLATVVVVHINHPNEIDEAVAMALTSWVDAGIPVLNQSVLLRGVNDDIESLVQLSQRLIELRCMPYYLHQLDRVSGTAHFEVPIQRGRELIQQMRNQLPGYAVPRYVCEVAGEPAKRILA